MWPNLQFPIDLITITEEISKRKLQNKAFATKKKKKKKKEIKWVSKFYFPMYKENIK